MAALWAVPLLSLASVVSGLALRTGDALASVDLGELYLADLWVAVIVPPVGAYILTRTAAQRLGVVLLSTAVLGVGFLAGNAALRLEAEGHGGHPLAMVGASVATWSWAPYLLLLTTVPLLVPDGRPLSSAWGRIANAAMVTVGALAVLSAVVPGPLDAFPALDNPLGIESAEWINDLGGIGVGAAVVIFVPLGVVSMALRWRRASHASQRREMAWMAGAIGIMAAAVLSASAFPYPVSDIVPAFGLTVVLVALAASVATVEQRRHHNDVVERSIVARESERTRLHRDLHDGVGPQLAGLALHLNAIGTTVTDGATRERLADAEETLRRTVDEIRRIVDDLRPPELDHLGLVAAIEERAAALAGASGVQIDVRSEVRAEGQMPAVEVALYRIACEAMTNVVRHASASHCLVELTTQRDRVRLVIEDDGIGSPLGLAPGNGTESMSARAVELGGTVRIDDRSHGRGLRVVATLPVVEVP